MTSVLVVGPRELPRNGQVEVWIDAGSGAGYETMVPSDLLALSSLDDGEGVSAIYELRVRQCAG